MTGRHVLTLTLIQGTCTYPGVTPITGGGPGRGFCEEHPAEDLFGADISSSPNLWQEGRRNAASFFNRSNGIDTDTFYTT